MEFVLFLIGAGVSWAIAHWYYKRASTDVPEWAKPLIEKLPDAPIPVDRLITLYHEALENGNIDMPEPIGGYVACPECGAPSSEFKSWEQTDFARDTTYRGMRCKKCGHEVSWTEM